MGVHRCTYILFIDHQHLGDLSLHVSLRWEVYSGCFSSDGGNIWVLTFASLFILATSPRLDSFRGRFTVGWLIPFSFSFLYVLSQLASFDQPLNVILQLDAVVGVVVVTFMKATILWLVSLRRLSDWKRGSKLCWVRIWAMNGLKGGWIDLPS